MVHGTVRSLFQLLGAIGVTVLVLAAWFAYRLTEAPLSLSLLRPYIEDALVTPDGSLSVKLDRTVLVWSRDSRTVEIRAEGVRAIARDQGTIAAVPEMAVSLSVPALLRGVVRPKSLRLYHPKIRLVRDSAGNLHYGIGETEAPGAEASPAILDAVDALLGGGGAGTAAGSLQRIEVVAGDLMIEDQALGVQWHAPQADFRFLRNAIGMIGHARLLLALGGEMARVEAHGAYSSGERAIDATLTGDGIRPAVFAGVMPPLQPLEGLHLPLGGTLSLHYRLDQGLTALRFDLTGGQGVIDVSPWLGVSWPVTSVTASGAFTDGFSSLALDQLRIDLGGPVVSLNASGRNLGGDAQLDASARIDNLPVDDLRGLWPPELAAHPRDWILANLSHGQVRSATARLAAHLPMGKPLDAVVMDRLEGEVVPEGVTVRYLAPMQPVKNVNAVATFDANRFDIQVKGGEVMGLKVTDGKVVLHGLSEPDQTAEIGLKIAGPVEDALRLIDSKPLGWPHKLGLDPARVKGDAVTQLDLAFPLVKTLQLDQLKVRAHAQTSHLAMPAVALGLDLADGSLGLQVDPVGLDLAGKALLGGQPAEIRWRENFSKAAPYRSRYHVKQVMSDAARNAVGLTAAPFQPPFLSGAIPIDLVATLNDGGTGDIAVKADLTPAAMELPGLNWAKPAGVAGQATASLRLADGKLSELPNFDVAAANGLDVQGQIAFDSGHARRVTFRRAKWGRTDLEGTMTIRPGDEGLAIDVSGSSFDGREMVSGRRSDPKTDKAAVKPEKGIEPSPTQVAKRELVTPLTVHATFRRLWVSDDGLTRDVTAAMVRDDRDWQQAHVDGLVDGGKPLHIELLPAGRNRRTLKLSSPDAGSVFRSFGLFENMVGGQLTMEGTFDDADPRQPLTGLATVADYQVVKAPALARLLTVAALTGIVEVLSGEGIHFSTLKAPFTLTDGVLELRDVRAYGTALGITAKGQVDLDSDMLALEGTVVPAYAINSVLGDIPLVGRLFSLEKGGGVIAMNYSMKGPAADPRVTVNPLSALTPGFLRKLFDVFDTGTETEVRPKAPTDKAAPAVPAPAAK